MAAATTADMSALPGGGAARLDSIRPKPDLSLGAAGGGAPKAKFKPTVPTRRRPKVKAAKASPPAAAPASETTGIDMGKGRGKGRGRGKGKGAPKGMGKGKNKGMRPSGTVMFAGVEQAKRKTVRKPTIKKDPDADGSGGGGGGTSTSISGSGGGSSWSGTGGDGSGRGDRSGRQTSGHTDGVMKMDDSDDDDANKPNSDDLGKYLAFDGGEVRQHLPVQLPFAPLTAGPADVDDGGKYIQRGRSVGEDIAILQGDDEVEWDSAAAAEPPSSQYSTGERLIFMQLPSHLPVRHRDGPAADASRGDSMEVDDHAAVDDEGSPLLSGAPAKPGQYLHQPEIRASCSGKIGKMKIRKSGRATLEIAGIEYEVFQGMPCSFPQNLLVLDSPMMSGGGLQPKAQASLVGTIAARHILTPNLKQFSPTAEMCRDTTFADLQSGSLLGSSTPVALSAAGGDDDDAMVD
eukprot:SAG31_NODE_1341_length_8708_cov_10.945174_13_plen_461_part_00